MKEVIRYKCKYCGELLKTKEECIKEENKHELTYTANEMLKEGYTLGEINSVTEIWSDIPEYLNEVNKDNCFIVEHWQCCEKPAYQITYINFDGNLSLHGCGSWSGYYGETVGLNFRHFKNPRPKEELFIDKRYDRMY